MLNTSSEIKHTGEEEKIVSSLKKRQSSGWMFLGLLIAVGITIGALLSDYMANDRTTANRIKAQGATSEKPTMYRPTVAFTMRGRQYFIDLPKGCKRAESSGNLTFFCGQKEEPAESIIIAARKKRSPIYPGPTKTLILSSGRMLTYRIGTRYAGTRNLEAILMGDLTLKGTNLVVSCYAQGDFFRPLADWCLPYIRTIRVKR